MSRTDSPKKGAKKPKPQDAATQPPADSPAPKAEGVKREPLPTPPTDSDGKNSGASPQTPEQPISPSVTGDVPRYKRFLLGLRVIRIELIVTSVALVISLGQYFESVVSVRVNISNIWREGYTSVNRDLVLKFRHVNEVWKSEHGMKESDINPSVAKLVYPKELYAPGSLSHDDFIKSLVGDEVPEGAPDEEYIKATLKYRDAMIDTLNTAEAVKAVIYSRPWPFRSSALYWDTLEARYKPVVEEIRVGLNDFIVHYRQLTKRDVPAWLVLTTDYTNFGDYVAVGMFFTVAGLFLWAIYFAKKEYRKIRKLPLITVEVHDADQPG